MRERRSRMSLSLHPGSSPLQSPGLSGAKSGLKCRHGPIPSEFHRGRNVLLHRDARRSIGSDADRAYYRLAPRRTADAELAAVRNHAIVVLPDHLHMVMTLPDGDADYPNRWRLIKRRFTDAVLKLQTPVARAPNGEVALWQRRYWQHMIRDEKDFERHVDYIHFNPVKHSFVGRVRDWPYSSFHRYVRQGLLPEDWAGDLARAAGVLASPPIRSPH